MARGPVGTVVEVAAELGAGADVVEVPLAAGFDDDEHAAIATAQQSSTASLRIEGA
jgi:hypothetical protein